MVLALVMVVEMAELEALQILQLLAAVVELVGMQEMEELETELQEAELQELEEPQLDRRALQFPEASPLVTVVPVSEFLVKALTEHIQTAEDLEVKTRGSIQQHSTEVRNLELMRSAYLMQVAAVH
jgi:hypothetical protein